MRPPRARLPPPALPTPAMLGASCPRMLDTPGSGRPRRRALQLSARRDFGDEWPTVARPAGGRDTSRGSPAMTITRVFPPCPPAVSAAPGTRRLPAQRADTSDAGRMMGSKGWEVGTTRARLKETASLGIRSRKPRAWRCSAELRAPAQRVWSVPWVPATWLPCCPGAPRTGFARGRLPRHGSCGFAGARLLRKRCASLLA